MKNNWIFKSTVLLIIIGSTALTGCSSKESVMDETQVTTVESSISKESPNTLEAQAQKEGISVEALQETLDGLVKIGAEKYGLSEEEYIESLTSKGQTVLSEWQVASENMGLSITELYAYEKQSLANLTEDQKDTLKGMGEALQEAESLDLENYGDSDGDGDNGAAANAILGMEGGDGTETKVLSLSEEELKEALAYKTYKVTQDYQDDYSIVYEYVSDAELEDLTAYYRELLLGTKNYEKMGTPESLVVMLQGTINETDVYIELSSEQGGMPTVSTYLDFSSSN
ncbi:hypothetical protein QE109_01695 [Fusibacter bizertensis]|uniref:Lipoprotein n=1 Tax=Fusibacter bizertensis TaxID=1488331 RepID=A0ABT6N8T2_9FIRM|nr:hypothetical protein [Fusibacter bizertensis]MDH8676837.1 hypothetical protein [Fusibacter bizertensis]